MIGALGGQASPAADRMAKTAILNKRSRHGPPIGSALFRHSTAGGQSVSQVNTIESRDLLLGVFVERLENEIDFLFQTVAAVL